MTEINSFISLMNASTKKKEEGKRNLYTETIIVITVINSVLYEHNLIGKDENTKNR